MCALCQGKDTRVDYNRKSTVQSPWRALEQFSRGVVFDMSERRGLARVDDGDRPAAQIEKKMIRTSSERRGA